MNPISQFQAVRLGLGPEAPVACDQWSHLLGELPCAPSCRVLATDEPSLPSCQLYCPEARRETLHAGMGGELNDDAAVGFSGSESSLSN